MSYHSWTTPDSDLLECQSVLVQIQHSDAQPLLSHEERRLRLEELDAVIAAGNARLPPGESCP